jgi:hypothetical protein
MTHVRSVPQCARRYTFLLSGRFFVSLVFCPLGIQARLILADWLGKGLYEEATAVLDNGRDASDCGADTVLAPVGGVAASAAQREREPVVLLAEAVSGRPTGRRWAIRRDKRAAAAGLSG